MKHPIAFAVILLTIQGTLLTVDAFDFINFISKAADKLIPPKTNNEKVIEALKKDNAALKVENDKLSESLTEETGAREQAEIALKEKQDLNDNLQQEIDALQQQLAEVQQQIDTCDGERRNCNNANEVLSAKIEQFKYSLEKCEQDKENETTKLNGVISNFEDKVANCENSLTSCRRDYNDFVTIAAQTQSQFTASLTSAAAESSAIESSYAALISPHNQTFVSDEREF